MKTNMRTNRRIAAIAGVLLLTVAGCTSSIDDTTVRSAPTIAPTTAVEETSDKQTTTEPPQTSTTKAPDTTLRATTEPESDAPPAATVGTTTSDLPAPPPEAGEPNTVTIVFDDGETATTSVSCDSDPVEQFFELTFRSFAGDVPRFELLFFAGGGEVSEWRIEDEIWLVSPTEGSIDVAGDLSQSPILGSAVFLEANLNERGDVQFTTPSGGQPLTTGVERTATFTIVCADFNGDGRTLTTGAPQP